MLKLTTIRKRIPVELEVEAGKVESCYLLEMTGGERSDYLLAVASRLNKDNTVQEKHRKLYMPNLIALCLFRSDDSKFTVQQISAFPPDTIKALFDASQDIIGLSKIAEEAAEKN